MSIELLAALEEAFPVQRQVKLEGFDQPLVMWRLSADQILTVVGLPRATQSELIEYGVTLCAMAIGDEHGPGFLDNDRGRAWLRRHPMLTAELSAQIREFSELTGPSDSRKKSSQTPESETSLPSPEDSDSTTQGESSKQSAPEL